LGIFWNTREISNSLYLFPVLSGACQPIYWSKGRIVIYSKITFSVDFRTFGLLKSEVGNFQLFWKISQLPTPTTLSKSSRID